LLGLDAILVGNATTRKILVSAAPRLGIEPLFRALRRAK
jgi:hypothetical protein